MAIVRLVAIAAVAVAASTPDASGSVDRYGVRLGREGVVVDVPYSMGTHHEHVTTVEGSIRVDPEALRLEGGRLVIPIASFRSDDAKRGCHLRESLGLDYRRSRFPREHVCDDRNRLPTSGPDAIAYPDILVELRRGAAASDGKVEAEAALTIHGVTRPVRLPLEVSRDGPSGMLRVRGSVPLRLSDFGVVVKSAGVLFVTISVRDEITVHLDVLLEPIGR